MSVKIGLKETAAWIDAVYIDKTYAGLIFGSPNKAMNDGMLASLSPSAIEKVGSGPFGALGKQVYDVDAQPVLVEPDREKKWLPSYYMFVLVSGPNTDNKSCGALALVILFAENLERSLEEMVNEACKDLVWEDVSYNYDI